MNNTQPSFRSYISGKQLPAAHGAPQSSKQSRKQGRQPALLQLLPEAGKTHPSLSLHIFFTCHPVRSLLCILELVLSLRVRGWGGWERMVAEWFQQWCPSLKAQPLIPTSGIVFVLFLPAAGPCKRSCKGPSEPQTYCRIWHSRFFTWMSWKCVACSGSWH